MKSTTPKVRLKFYKSTEDADSSVDISDSSIEKVKEFFDGSDKEILGDTTNKRFAKASESFSRDQESPIPICSSPCTPFTPYSCQPEYTNKSSTAVITTAASLHVDRAVGSTPDNKSTFFTPPTPVSLKHRHWSISRANCSTPNNKQWTNSMLLTSTPAGNNCLLSTSPMVASADDMSPITRSTQRMTKAMQVSNCLLIVYSRMNHLIVSVRNNEYQMVDGVIILNLCILYFRYI